MANTVNAQYVAITCSEKWLVRGISERGEDRAQFEARMRAEITRGVNPVSQDIYTKTQLGNLQVMSLSAAKRAYPRELRQYLEWQAYEEGSSVYPSTPRPVSLP